MHTARGDQTAYGDVMPLPIEDYAAHRRPAHRRAGRQERLGRLAVPAAVRLPGLLRGAARRREQRSLAAGARRPATTVTPALRRRHSACSRRPSRPPRRGQRHGRDADRRQPRRPRAPGRRACRGTVRMRHEWVVRFDYGLIRPWVRRAPTVDGDEEVITAVAGPGQAGAARPAAPARRRRPARRRVRRRGGRAADVLDDLGPVVRRRTRRRSTCDDRIETDPIAEERVGRTCCHADGPYRDAGRALAARPAAADPRARPAASWPRRPPRCPRTSAASATGTTATAGCATRADPRGAARCRLHRGGRALARLAAPRRRRRPRGPADHVRRRRRAATCPSASSTTCPATRARGRSGSATARSTSSRPTCWAR